MIYIYFFSFLEIKNNSSKFSRKNGNRKFKRNSMDRNGVHSLKIHISQKGKFLSSSPFSLLTDDPLYNGHLRILGRVYPSFGVHQGHRGHIGRYFLLLSISLTSGIWRISLNIPLMSPKHVFPPRQAILWRNNLHVFLRSHWIWRSWRHQASFLHAIGQSIWWRHTLGIFLHFHWLRALPTS